MPWARPALLLLLGLLALAIASGSFVVGSRLIAGDARVPGLIAFDAEGDIWTVRDDGTGLTRLTDTSSGEANPVWSPDGTEIAYSLVLDGKNHGIAVMTADGTPVQELELPRGLSQPSFPVWTPDGDLATRAVDPNGKGVIVLWYASTPKLVETSVFTDLGHVLELEDSTGDFNLSPDGATIAFQGDPDAVVLAADADGTDVRQVTTGPCSRRMVGRSSTRSSPRPERTETSRWSMSTARAGEWWWVARPTTSSPRSRPMGRQSPSSVIEARPFGSHRTGWRSTCTSRRWMAQTPRGWSRATCAAAT
jgi:hypothetical protein